MESSPQITFRPHAGSPHAAADARCSLQPWRHMHIVPRISTCATCACAPCRCTKCVGISQMSTASRAIDFPTSSPMPHSLASNAVCRCGPPSMFSQGSIDVHVPSWLQRAPSIGCSMGAACMWSTSDLRAGFHDDRAALRKYTPTFSARSACAQLGSGVHVGGGSWGPVRAGRMLSDGARCSCQLAEI